METHSPNPVPGAARRNEDIALDLLRFIADRTDLGKMGGVGFQQTAGSKPQAVEDRILELYGRCLHAVQGGRK